MPRICIDGRQVPGAATGVARYAANLYATLARTGAAPLRLIDATRPIAPPRAGLLSMLGRLAMAARPGARQARIAGPDQLIADDIFREAQRHFDLFGRLLRIALPGPPGVMHWTYPLPLRARGWRNVYTVHDLIPVLQPALTPIDRRRYARLLCAVARDADRIVTVSRAVREDVIGWLDFPPDRVVDCGQGISPAAQPAAALPHGLHANGFFLVVGTIEPRKNVAALIEAHARSGSRRALVLAGPDGWQADRIHIEAARVPGVMFLGFQAADMLARLMADATALLFPSLAEGFGLPVIEAMAAGTPVLTSSTGALAEVAGDAALLVDPVDVAAIAHGIARLDRDDGLRARLAAAGCARAGHYAPQRHAERLLALYRDVAGETQRAEGQP